jgi:hypothetical protein
MEILEKYVEDILLKRPETSLLKEPVLLIMDSYEPHITAQSKKYEKRNILIELVLPNMTGVLQPLNVAVNKSFQDSFETSYDTYIAKAPNYEIVSNWVVNWEKEFESNIIVKAFTKCGIGSILDNFNIANFLKQYGHIFETENYFSTIELVEWFWPQKVSTSLFECIQKAGKRRR